MSDKAEIKVLSTHCIRNVVKRMVFEESSHSFKVEKEDLPQLGSTTPDYKRKNGVYITNLTSATLRRDAETAEPVR